MIKMIESIKGTRDILPPESELWRSAEAVARGIFAKSGYGEIRTPIIEDSALFIRGVGKDTDIIQKQMYSFTDQGQRNICLRPEATASVVRAYIEHNLHKTESIVKLFYCGTMYRSEKPQAGRQREFTQIGVEVLGSYSPYSDCEIIVLLDDILKALHVGDYQFKINSLGCEKDKEKFKGYLKQSIKKDVKKMCEDCQRRYASNILRILDCKNEQCRTILESLDIKHDYLCEECAADFNKITDTLKNENINFKKDPFLVRGLDYYTKVVFEVTAKGLGSQDAIAAGGRYNNLVKELGGPQTGACGFAIGVERLMAVAACDKIYQEKPLDLFLVCMNDKASQEAFYILHKLRLRGISCDMDYSTKSLKAQMRYADKIKAGFVIVIGENELTSRQGMLKNMKTGDQKQITLDKIAESLC
ncbi:MAG: histidine--tRNA ligase [Candidatus Omnitrophica bacterium]|nr:histidine--tRNA ligase [Candidatus Omnitrophota bacterium]